VRLATLRTAEGGTTAVRVEGHQAIPLPFPDVGSLLADPGGMTAAAASTPVGPWLVTPDEVDHVRDLRITCAVDGEVMQDARTSDLVFRPEQVLSYISQIITLVPGDLVSTGTAGGVGMARSPQAFLAHGQVVTTEIDGIGVLQNRCERFVP
jgi:2-keto-4-pentenoate hydratase/2-oxohepta-3-ene-1,7-dioic acid hydratase in catechol pathway